MFPPWCWQSDDSFVLAFEQDYLFSKGQKCIFFPFFSIYHLAKWLENSSCSINLSYIMNYISPYRSQRISQRDTETCIIHFFPPHRESKSLNLFQKRRYEYILLIVYTVHDCMINDAIRKCVNRKVFKKHNSIIQNFLIRSDQSLSRVRLFATP